MPEVMHAPSDDVEIFQTSLVSFFSKIGNAGNLAACYFVDVPKVPLPVRWGSPTRDQVASSFYFLHDAYPQKTPSVPYVPCLRRIGFFCSPICCAAAAASCMAGDQNQKAAAQRQSDAATPKHSERIEIPRSVASTYFSFRTLELPCIWPVSFD